MSEQDPHALTHSWPTQSLPGDPSLPEEPRLIRAVQEYMSEVDSGRRPNRGDFLKRHSEIAGVLSDYLDALDFVRAATPTLGDGSGRGRREPSAQQAPSLDPNIPLGDFRIVREIGRGGMGVVYEAEELSLNRRVALKVLPFAWTLDSRQLQRFKNEARAAAQLHHSHIVPIYSVGCERGVHFYAMQYIEGRTLADVIRELREFEKMPREGVAPPSAVTRLEPSDGANPHRENLDIDTIVESHPSATALSRGSSKFFDNIAEFGIQAAEALDHAHQYGVVHRDIKPANLLIDLRGVLWVTDFGLAQFPTDGMLTMSGDLLGTLRYMSPEQALAKRGLVDHRTDIYSLGVTLYELLTLEPVYDGRDREELLRQLTFEEPKPPRRRNPAIPHDLETIVLKAMAKSVEDRYASARELAEDLRRFVDQVPIKARRPPLAERIAKWSRRHWKFAAAAMAMVTLAAVGFATATAVIARAYQSESNERARAEANFAQARQAVDKFTELTEDRLADRPDLQGMRREFLTASLAYYQNFIEQSKDDPELSSDLATTSSRVANILEEIGTKSDANAAWTMARHFHEKHSRSNPNSAESARAFEMHMAWKKRGEQVRLLEMPAVRVELSLDSEQQRLLEQLAKERGEIFRGERRLSPQEWADKVQGMESRFTSLLDGLRSEQSQRLQQLVWQQKGAFALDEVADVLQLTQAQLNTLQEIEDSMRRFSWGGRGPGGSPLGSSGGPGGRGGPPMGQPGKDHEEVWRQTRERMLEVLTAEQLAAWIEMQGAPFDFDAAREAMNKAAE